MKSLIQALSESEDYERSFTPAQAKLAVELSKAFVAMGANAVERSKESYRLRESSAPDTVYWSKIGATSYVPSPTKKQKKWSWIDDARRVTPGKLRLNIVAAGSDVAVVEWGRMMVDGEKKSITNVLFETSKGAAEKLASAG